MADEEITSNPYDSTSGDFTTALKEIYQPADKTLLKNSTYIDRLNVALKTRADSVVSPVRRSPDEQAAKLVADYNMMTNTTPEGQKQYLRTYVQGILKNARYYNTFANPGTDGAIIAGTNTELPNDGAIANVDDGSVVPTGDARWLPFPSIPSQGPQPGDKKKAPFPAIPSRDRWNEGSRLLRESIIKDLEDRANGETAKASDPTSPTYNTGTSAILVSALQQLSEAKSGYKRDEILHATIGAYMADALEKSGLDIDNMYSWKSLWKIKGDIAAELIPGRQTWEYIKFGGFGTVHKFYNMSIEDKLTGLAAILQKMNEDNVSPLTKLAVIDRLAGDWSEGLQQAGVAVFGLTDIVGGIASYAKIPKYARYAKQWAVLRKIRNSPQLMAIYGAKDSAAGVVAASVLNATAEIQRATGMDKVTAGLTLSPFHFEKIDPGVAPGLSARALRKIEDQKLLQAYYLERAINATLTQSSGFLRPAERVAAEANIRAAMPTDAEIITSTPFGLQIRVKLKPPAGVMTVDEAKAALDVAKARYEEAVKALDMGVTGATHPSMQPYINSLQQTKELWKAKMVEAETVLESARKYPDGMHERFVWFTRDMANGPFNGTMEVNPLSVKTLSPEAYLRNIDDLLVSERTTILAKQEGLHNLFKKAYVNAVQDLGKYDNLNWILRHGDDVGKKFTVEELHIGVDIPGKGTVKLNKKEIAAYYKTRDTFDAMHHMRSVMKLRRLEFDGFNKESIIEILGEKKRVFLKDARVEYKKADGTIGYSFPSSIDAIYDADRRTVVKLSKAAKEKIMHDVESGRWWLARAEQPLRETDHLLNVVLVRAEKVEDLKPGVLSKKNPGYIPRIYESNPYVVRALHKVKVDGQAGGTIQEVKAFFHNQKAAQTWADEQTASTKIKHTFDSDHNLRFGKDPDMDYKRAVDEAVFSGLYEDYRGQAVKFGKLDDRHNIQFGETPQLSALDAMDKYMNNLSWAYPMNEWRQGAVQRYINTVGPHLETPSDWMSPLKHGTGLNAEQRTAVLASRDWLMQTLAINNAGERTFSRTLQYLAERMDGVRTGSIMDKARMKLLYGAENVDAIGLLRNMTWRLTLGLGNLSQIVVQSANMASVFMLHPLQAPAIARRIMALRVMAFAHPSEAGYEGLLKIAARAALMSPEEFRPIIHAFSMSGMAYTARSSADVASAMRGLSTGGDIRNLASMADKILATPYLETELWARMYGFLDAYTRMRKGTLAKELANVDEVNELVTEAFRTSFNYTQVNRAAWQKGLLSLPSQFMGPTARFYEELFLPIVSGQKKTSRFTRWERGKLVMGNLLMYGLVGMPAGVYAKNVIGKWLSDGGDPYGAGLSPEQAVAITGGVTDFLAHEVVTYLTGDETYPVVASRQALANGFDIFARNVGEGASIKKLALGAFGSIPERAMRALHEIAVVQGTQFKEDWKTVDVAAALDTVATLAKSWDNVRKARLWEQHNAIMSNNYGILEQIDPEKHGALFDLKRVGIASYEEDWLRDLHTRVQDMAWDKDVKAAVQDSWLLTMAYMEGNWLNTSKVSQYMISKNMIRESLPTEAAKDAYDKAWNAFLLDPTTQAGRAVAAYYENFDKGVQVQDPLAVGVNTVNDNSVPTAQTEPK